MDSVVIPLRIGFEVVVDAIDYEKISKKTWHFKKAGNGIKLYAATSVWKNKTIYMHRFILDCPPDKEVDHLNGNGLDNRRANLEIVSKQQNMRRRWHGRKRK